MLPIAHCDVRRYDEPTEAEFLMPKYFEFEVELLEIEPRNWRRFQLAAVSSFKTLHNAIQDAFGWQRKHLYEFRHFEESKPGIKTPVRRIARCKQAEILDDEVVPFADELRLASFSRRKRIRERRGQDWHVGAGKPV